MTQTNGWPLVPLGELLTRNETLESLVPDRQYREVTIRLWGNGVVLRRVVTGADIAAEKRIRVSTDQFIASRIDARNGAMGIVPPALDGAIVTNDFPSFDVNRERLLPSFLGWLSRTGGFVDLCRAASEGTTNRVRLKEERFLRLTIPLPPLEEQRRIVAKLDRLAAKIEEARRHRRDATENVNRLLVCMAHRQDMSEEQKLREGWTQTTLCQVIVLRPDPVKVDTATNYPNLGIYSFARGLFKKPPIEGMTTSADTLFRVRAGQFIYSRLFAFEGAYGIVPPELDGHFVSNEYPTFDCEETKVRPEFLEAYFKSSEVWQRVAIGSKGLGDRRQRVQPEQVLKLSIWLPPINWQKQIVETRSKLIHAGQHRESIEEELDSLLPSILDRAFKGAL